MAAKRKKKEKDFQKVKLKVGRSIPKCLNETDTSFQTRKILMPSSRIMDDDPIGALISSLSDRKSLKLLKLGKANHYLNDDEHVKVEVITVDVINTLCRHLMDEHYEVRKGALDGLNHCFNVLINDSKTSPSNNSSNLDAIIGVVITHLKCALTHLDNFIYKDSWKLLINLIDKLINHQQLNNSSIDQLGHLMVSVFGSRQHPLEHYESLALVIDKMFPKDAAKDVPKEGKKLIWSNDNYHVDLLNCNNDALSMSFCISFNATDLSGSIREETKKKLNEVLSNDFKMLMSDDNDVKLDRKMRAISRIHNKIK